MKKEEIYNEAIGGDEGFAPGEGYPSRDGQPCANVSGDDGVATDTMTDATPTGDEGPSDGAASGEAGEESGVEAGVCEQLAPELERRIAEWQDNTGADYPFYSMDASTIQTIVRGNPGIVLLHDGVIVQKVRPVHLPEEAELNAPLDELPFGQLRPYTFRRPLLTVLVVFFVPMLLLLLTSKTVEAYVVQARVRRVARLRKIREAVMEKNRKNKEENQL